LKAAHLSGRLQPAPGKALSTGRRLATPETGLILALRGAIVQRIHSSLRLLSLVSKRSV